MENPYQLFENINNSISDNNILAYKVIFIIENGLRELIIEKLSELEGNKWFTKRLPSDIYSKYKIGYRIESKIKLSHQIIHHPLYYIDFPDLKKIIEENRNWSDVFSNYFSQKSIFTNYLSSIESIRNKVAHNRIVTDSEINILKTVLTMLVSPFNNGKFLSLAMNISSCTDIKDELKLIGNYINNLYISCTKYACLKKNKNYKDFFLIIENWWFNEEVLDINLDSIFNFSKILLEYFNLIEGRGLGYIKENFINKSDFKKYYLGSIKIVNKLIQ